MKPVKNRIATFVPLFILMVTAKVATGSSDWKFSLLLNQSLLDAKPLTVGQFDILINVPASTEKKGLNVILTSSQIKQERAIFIHNTTYETESNLEVSKKTCSTVSSLSNGLLDKLICEFNDIVAKDSTKNRVVIKGMLTVLDPIDAVSNEEYWLSAFASTTGKEEYFWLGEEKISFSRPKSLFGRIELTAFKYNPIFETAGEIVDVEIWVGHDSKSKATLENVHVQMHLPQFLILQESNLRENLKKNDIFTYDKTVNKVTIKIPRIWLKTKRKYKVPLQIDPGNTLPILENQIYRKFILGIISYMVKNSMLTANFNFNFKLRKRLREEKQFFYIKHKKTRDCVSQHFHPKEMIAVSRYCTKNLFRFTDSGNLQTKNNTKMCLFPEKSTFKFKECDLDYHNNNFVRKGFVWFLKHDKVSSQLWVDLRSMEVVKLNKAALLLLIPELRKGKVIELPSKAFIGVPESNLFFFCSRRNNIMKRKCYYTKNNGKSWIGLHPIISTLAGFHKSTNTLYGRDNFGMVLTICQLKELSNVVLQDTSPTATLGDTVDKADTQTDDMDPMTTNIQNTGWSASRKGLHYSDELKVDYGF